MRQEVDKTIDRLNAKIAETRAVRATLVRTFDDSAAGDGETERDPATRLH